MKTLDDFKNDVAKEKGFSNWADLLKYQFSHLIIRDLEDIAIRFALYNRLSKFQQVIYSLLGVKIGKQTGSIAKTINVKSANLSNQLKLMQKKGVVISEKIGKNLHWKINTAY